MIAKMALCWIAVLLLCNSALAYSVPRHVNGTSSIVSSLTRRDETDPADFSWVRRWAAIGDSFTAGIGAGVNTGAPGTDAWACSRYSYSWAEIVNRALGPSVQDFQFVGCSGDRTEEIYRQAQNLKGNLDLVMLTAGGNDLCLSDMIKECVFLPWKGEQACQDVIDKAQENIDTILKPNIQFILNALESKVKDDGIVVYSGYAPFFNTDNEDCGDSTKHEWAWHEWYKITYWFKTPLPLNIERRKKFNQLVANINQAIKSVVDDNDGKLSYRIAFSDWSDWPAIVDGEMCSPRSDGKYPDPNQPNLQFFKPNTWVPDHSDGLKRDIHGEWADEVQDYFEEMKHNQENDSEIYDSSLWKSRNPPAVALNRLNPRAPAPPNCPGDGGVKLPFGIGLPDWLLKCFHPNEAGHETIAASALQNVVWMRALMLGQAGCSVGNVEELLCWQHIDDKPNRPYVSWDRLNINHKDFCDSVQVPSNTINWSWEKKYHDNTPEQHGMVIKLSNGASAFDKDRCLEAFDKIINRCDGDDPNNPLNFKFGGRLTTGDHTYEINPTWDRPLVKRMDGSCNSHYHWFYADYDISGSGWIGWDNGQETLLPAIKGCLGLGVTKWNFRYCPKQEDCGGFEWRVDFRTPVFVKARCFANLRVAKASGGYHHEWDRPYENAGCGGSDA